MPAVMEISVFPAGKQGASLGDVMVEVLKVAEKHGANYELTAMGTCLEGELRRAVRDRAGDARGVLRAGLPAGADDDPGGRPAGQGADDEAQSGFGEGEAGEVGAAYQ